MEAEIHQAEAAISGEKITHQTNQEDRPDTTTREDRIEGTGVTDPPEDRHQGEVGPRIEDQDVTEAREGIGGDPLAVAQMSGIEILK